MFLLLLLLSLLVPDWTKRIIFTHRNATYRRIWLRQCIISHKDFIFEKWDKNTLKICHVLTAFGYGSQVVFEKIYNLLVGIFNGRLPTVDYPDLFSIPTERDFILYTRYNNIVLLFDYHKLYNISNDTND